MMFTTSSKIHGKWLFVFVFLLFFLLGYTYYDGLLNLFERWANQEEYSYGYFVPMIAAYMVILRIPGLELNQIAPNLLGVVVVLIGLLLLFIGELGAIYILIHYSLVVVLLGLVLSISGYGAMKRLLVPILILLTAIPLPYFLDSELSWRLQLISSKLGVYIIRLFDIPVFLEGNVIDLGYYKLQVVEACSGLSYLFPLMSLGFIAACVYRGPFWHKVILFLSTIPITVGMNSIRIGVIGILVNYSGIEQAEGFLHFFEGWVIFIACLFLLWLAIYVLTKLRSDKPSVWDTLELSASNKNNHRWSEIKIPVSVPLLLSSISIIISSVVLHFISERNEILPERKDFSHFSSEIGEWKAKRGGLKKNIQNYLQLDDYYLADFSRDNHVSVNLYMAYYKTQRKGVSPHSPRVCIPGGGWKIIDSQNRYINIDNNKVIPVNRIVIERGNAKQLVYYWFKQRQYYVANEYVVKWLLLKDAIVANRTDGALIRLTTILREHETELQADKRIISLISGVYPELSNYIPD